MSTQTLCGSEECSYDENSFIHCKKKIIKKKSGNVTLREAFSFLTKHYFCLCNPKQKQKTDEMCQITY